MTELDQDFCGRFDEAGGSADVDEELSAGGQATSATSSRSILRRYPRQAAGAE